MSRPHKLRVCLALIIQQEGRQFRTFSWVMSLETLRQKLITPGSDLGQNAESFRTIQFGV